MDNGVRWVIVAAVLGFCTAYALWGGRPQTAPLPLQRGPAPAPIPGTVTTTSTPPVPIVSSAPTVLKFSPENVDFGEINVSEKRDVSVLVKNAGASVVNVTEVRGNCGCLRLDMPKKELQPGESQPLNMTFIGQSGRRAESYLVTLLTDEPGMPVVSLTVHGRVVQVFIVEPQTLYYEYVAKDHAKTMDCTITRCDGKPFKIQNIAASHPEFTFSWAPVSGSNQSVYKILATVRAPTPGVLTEGVAILTDHPSVPAQVLYLSARITGDVVSLSPVLSAAQPSDASVEPFKTVIKRLTPGKLEIQSVTDSQKRPVQFSVRQLDEFQCEITVKLLGTFPDTPPVGDFLVQTNAESTPLHVPYSSIRRGPFFLSTPPIPRAPLK